MLRRLATGWLLLLWSALPAGAGEVPFARQPDILPYTTQNRSAEAADIDGDGDLDVIVASWDGGGSLDWRENTAGDGSAWTVHSVGTPTQPFDVHAADIDRDGDLDLVYVSLPGFSEAISWRENLNGDGSSWSSANVILTPSGSPPDGIDSILPADVDGDGDIDILWAESDDDDVHWARNSNDGGSWAQQTIDSSLAGGPTATAAGDVDRDGDLDVVVTRGGFMVWYANTGSGSFFSTEYPIGGGGSARPYLADVDGDGDLDVVQAYAWYENTGSYAGLWTSHPLPYGPGGIDESVPHDVDADGDVDVLTYSAVDELEFLENTAGDGSAWTRHTYDTPGPEDFQTLSAADIDGDGDFDVLTAARATNTIAWYRNDTIHRNALFPASERVVVGTGKLSGVADVDGDGDLDALGSFSAADEVLWFENSAGDGSSWVKNVIDGAFSTGGRTIGADVDGDGDVDAISSSANANELAWHENTAGDGSAWTKHAISSDNGTSKVTAVDLDGDGDLDVLSPSSLNQVAWYENVGGLGLSWTDHTIDTGSGTPGAGTAADLDGDGDLDVVWNHRPSTTHDTAWYENTAGDASSFTEHLVVSEGGVVSAIHAVDMDGDGDLDLVRSSTDDDTVAWHENTAGDATSWSTHTISTVADVPVEAFPADLDRDGDVDLAMVSSYDDTVGWYENTDGVGTSWSTHTITTAADFADNLVVGDVNRDGAPDLLASSAIGLEIDFYPNLGGQFLLGTIASPTSILEGSSGDPLSVGVWHTGRAGDGDAEVATIELQFLDDQGTPLDTAQAEALFDEVKIMDPTGTTTLFTTGVDNLALSAAGVLTLSIPDGDPGFQVPAGVLALNPLRLVLEADAGSQTPHLFQVVHLTESGGTAEDAAHDLPLDLGFFADTGSGVIGAFDPALDEDADGLSNGDELGVYASDPLDDDTDDDGLLDGDEVNTYSTSPTDADSDDDGLDDGTEVAQGSAPDDPDTDGDGFCDGPSSVGGTCTGGDNCLFVSNAGQENNDSAPQGDACQCGDIDVDGVIDADDVEAARNNLVGHFQGPTDLSRCNVIGASDGGATDCDVADIYVMERIRNGKSVAVGNDCSAFGAP